MRILLAALLLSSSVSSARELAVRPGSQVTYIVDEDRSVIGRSTVRGVNEGVTGSVAWSDSAGRAVLPATLSIDATGFKTGSSGRDKKVPSILDAGAHPKILFVLESCAPTLAKPLPAKAVAKGTLEIHGVRKAIEIPVTIGAAPDGKTISVAGAVSATFADFGMKPPHLPMISTVHADLRLEVSLILDAP